MESVRPRVPGLGDAPLDYGMLAELTGFPLKLVWIIGYTLLTRHIDDPAVTPQRFSMLELIGTNPGLPQTQLGAALGLSRPATTLAIDFWQARGCVERRTEPNDRRSFGIHLTEKGADELERLRGLVAISDAVLTQNLSGEEVGELRRLLAKIHG
ncbi:DNA-binding MarR family transcriptional regulator [Altererythrobacter atlanticus]|uniref:MarR family winged helix-turn-helix transcriptional regulator n=1 Tax=Croceibacterium atlanticum TaxID=1267766 RepID=UPI00146FE581|nr:MarR family transcriptional regulator [Croceibacterium atlanticum]MBB5732196.1 DNA-binding MarR family transcriptional regulator [Croceibacterium atlanticum]